MLSTAYYKMYGQRRISRTEQYKIKKLTQSKRSVNLALNSN